MQGLALAYLLQTVGEDFGADGRISAVAANQALTALLLCVMIWHEYAMGTIAFQWTLDMWDSTIPFLFGIAEYFMIATIDIPEVNHPLSHVRISLWLYSLAAICCTSCLAYWNQTRKAQREGMSKTMNSSQRRSLLHALLMLLASLALAIIHSYRPVVPEWHSAMSVLVTAAFAVQAVRIGRTHRRWRIR